MNVATLAAVLSAWVLGVLIVSACRPGGRAWRDEGGLILSLGGLVGVGATSVLFFLASLLTWHPARLAGGVELAAGLALLAWLLRRRGRNARAEFPPVAATSWLQWLLASILVQVIVVAVVVGWRAYRAEPYGGWDGWAIWNLHARFMLRAGPEWTTLLAAPQINWTHPDYPRLVPASVARAWAWAGSETPAAAALVSAAFAVATLGLLVSAVARLRGRIAALAGGLLLAGTPFFVTFAPNQHADIPLASFMLAAVLLVVLGNDGRAGSSGWFGLAGVCAGFAAGTKNEGLLFVLGLAAICAVRTWRGGSRRAFGFLIGGLAVALVPVGIFKFGFAPANDLLAAPVAPRIAQLFDVARHGVILSAFGRELGRFGEWQMLPYVAMALPFLAWRARRRLKGGESVIPVMLGLMLAGYYGVYLTSPLDLTWHLDTSLVRLLLQLWPIALAWWCLTIPLATEPVGPDLRTGFRRAIWVGANLIAAAVLVNVLMNQLGVNELAIRRGRPADVIAALGEGWFGLERHGRDTWAWSEGRAGLRLHIDERRTATPVTLRFALRGLGPRTVTAKAGERVLWQGALGEAFVPVEIAALDLPAGGVTLEFSTDAPGVAESPAAGARALAFAIYNVELK